MTVIFASSQSLELFRNVVCSMLIWEAFFTFYNMDRLVEGQDVESSSRLLQLRHCLLSLFNYRAFLIHFTLSTLSTRVGKKAKMWNLVIAFFYWHVNSDFLWEEKTLYFMYISIGVVVMVGEPKKYQNSYMVFDNQFYLRLFVTLFTFAFLLLSQI